ncbi:MAG: CHASE domain-containing protein [Bdellovibrio sp.]|nr:CHASE domain-containing protein [Bdellovibrio sp.]
MKKLKRLLVLSHEWNVFLVLLIIISISLFSWWTVKVHLEKEWQARLDFEMGKVTGVIDREFYGYGQALMDLKAVFQVGGIFNSKEFKEYIESTQVLRRFPGMQGIGFAQKLERTEFSDLEKNMRTQGYEDFKFWPDSERSLYTSITLIQPEDWRNKKALGFDMSSELIRRTAMDKSLIENSLTISDPVILVQEDAEVHQRGVLIYLPVKKIVQAADAQDPKDALLGFSYAIVRINRFFNGAFGVPEFYNEKINYRIEIFDKKMGTTIPVYERFPSREGGREIPEFSRTYQAKVFDKNWTIHFEPLPHFFNWYERYIPILFAFVTLVMLSVIFVALWSTQQFLKFSERHKNSLSQISKNKSEEIALFRKLNMVKADLSAAIDGDSIFDRFCMHMSEVFGVDDCVVFVREQKGPYEKRFQKILNVFPDFLPIPTEFEDFLSEGILPSRAQDENEARALDLLSNETRALLADHPYYMVGAVLHESGKKTSVLVILRGPENLCDSEMKEYAIQRVVGQFAMSYDKAILLRRAEDANFMKSSFLANMSHEIRTPLGVIVGYSEILADEELSPQEKEAIGKSIKRNGKELARLIDDILDISKVEAGKLHFEMAQVNLESLIHEIKSIMEARAIDKKIQFNIAKLSNVPSYVVTDDVRLKQILVNIVGNAIKFTEKGGVKILYKTGTNEAGEQYLEFQVQDTGVGISEKGREVLFKAFSQADVSTTRKYGGTGLGLALSKRLAQLLGGDLFLLESSIGKGSTFCLRIPLKDLNQGTMLTMRPEVTSMKREGLEDSQRDIDWVNMDLKNLLRGTRILLVEDSEDNQEIFSHFLRGAGAEVQIAEDGLTAVEQAFKFNPDIILMDIQIPKMDGREATKKIRQKGFTKNIIALTAHALHEELQSTLEAGCNGQITKPVSGELLLQEVYFYLNHRSS